MAITEIYVGGAKTASAGTTDPGDQGQNQSASTDLSGEVSMRRKTESEFLSSFGAYNIYRPKNPDEATIIAQIVIKVCNNPNIGYSQDKRRGIFTYGADATTPCDCDCSSLVSYAVSQAMGVTVDGSTSTLPDLLKNTGKFFDPMPVKECNFDTNPPYNGDILLKSGHTETVLKGNPREGKEDEIISGTWTGDGTAVIQYRNTFGPTYNFTPRTTEPSDSHGFYDQTYCTNRNGSYAWGRFSEIMKQACDLYRGDCKKWYVYKEDGYKGGVAANVGAAMCYTNIYDPNDPGFACIVEQVSGNDILVSQRDPKTGAFQCIQKTKKNGSWDMDLDGDGKNEYVFQGFIYNPAVSVTATSISIRETFITNAKDQEGDGGSYVKKYTGVKPKKMAWSAAFVTAVASHTGSLLNIIIPNTTSCSDIGRVGILRSMGTWFDGPAQGGNPQPELGDIVLFRTSTYSGNLSKYGADKAGIVVEITDSNNQTKVLGTNESKKITFTVMMGDVKGKVAAKSYTTSSKTLSGIFRPNWAQVDGTTQSVQQYQNIEGLYTEGTGPEDASIRDLRNIKITKNGIQPSIKMKGITLCAINYTGMLANLYSTFANVGSSSATDANLVVDLWQSVDRGASIANTAPIVSVSTSSNVNVEDLVVGGSVVASGEYYGTVRKKTITMTNTVKQIFTLLDAEIDNPAGTIGIMGNMCQECDFDIAAVNQSDGGSGLIQWTDTQWSNRCTRMKQYCQAHGGDWKTNLEGQIQFLFWESNPAYTEGYESLFKTGLDKIKKVPNTLEGAKEAARHFLDYYEIGGPSRIGTDLEVENYKLRSGWAAGIWKLFFGDT